jgi:hypothetical protein
MNIQAAKHRRLNPASPIQRALFCSPAIYRRADIQASIAIQFPLARPEINFRATKQRWMNPASRTAFRPLIDL